MDFIVISIVALFASGLTLFSGFGLGTILMPAFAIFFPLDVAIALTAIVHFLNNIFKLLLLGKHADKESIIKFGIPAILAAFIGARLLVTLSHLPPIIEYSISDNIFGIYLVKLVIAVLMILFAVFETLPKFEKISFDKKYLPLGGLLSGFFGGISGHQGALRSAFLVKTGLSKESFIATGVVIAFLIDITRISVYFSQMTSELISSNITLLTIAILAAFTGAFLGNKLLKKITIKTVQKLVAFMLFIIAFLLGAGII